MTQEFQTTGRRSTAKYRVLIQLMVGALLFCGCGGPQRGLNYADSSMWRELGASSYYARDTKIPSGAGANLWSESNVRVDESSVALDLRTIEGTLYAAEAVRATPVRSGERVSGVIELDPSGLEDNTVFGLFLYRDDSSELDIEVTRWGKANAPNLHFSVHGKAHRTKSFSLPTGATEIDASICVSPGSVRFTAISADQTFEWTVQEELPEPLPEMLHLNLWSRTPLRSVKNTHVKVSNLQVRQVDGCN